ncbi:MAG: esterase family protein [Mycobacterium sp.]|nr:MAG: esterase family protein [Mycobacterium sp.]
MMWALSGLLEPTRTPAIPAPSQPEAGNPVPTRTSGSFVSAARGGVTTNWVILRPPGQTGPLRPVIALHGRGGSANTVTDLGVDDVLAQLVREGRPPFAVVGVDGGDTYWHRRASGQDSGAMVLTELLPRLHAMGLDTSRVAFLGWSMGGYGALLLGSRLGPQRTAGICAVSPALFTSYAAAAPGAFDSYEDWMRNSVFGLAALSSIPLRVDCGTGDRFYSATRQFVAQLRTPVSGGFAPGGHTVSYWRAQLPAELAWLGS